MCGNAPAGRSAARKGGTLDGTRAGDRSAAGRLVAGGLALVVACSVGRAGLAEPSPAAEAGEALDLAARVRGLSFLRRPCLRFATEAQVLERVRRRVRSQYGPEDLAREGRLLELLGLLDPGTPYERAVYSALGSEVGGFYDVEDRCIYLTSPAREGFRSTVVHEAVHALQDQHFDLGRLLGRRPGESDRLAAASALVEGDATVAARLAERGGRGLGRGWAEGLRRALLEPLASRRDRLGRHLDRALAFGYGEGARLVAGLHRRSGFAAVDAMLRDPPASTEAVLHPERRDPPVALVLDSVPALAADGRPAMVETLGEALLASALAEQLGERAGAEAVRGWGGDRALLFDGPGRGCLVLVSVWDPGPGGEDGPAARFEAALGEALGRRHGRAERAGGRRLHRHPGGACSTLARRGRAVTHLAGVPCDAVAEVEELAMRAARAALALEPGLSPPGGSGRSRAPAAGP